MPTKVGAFTQQVKHVVILLHVVVLLVAAVLHHLIAAGEPALQPRRAGPPDCNRNVVWGRKFTPVEDVEPLCSFTVTQMVLHCCYSTGDIQLIVPLPVPVLLVYELIYISPQQ